MHRLRLHTIKTKLLQCTHRQTYYLVICLLSVYLFISNNTIKSPVYLFISNNSNKDPSFPNRINENLINRLSKPFNYKSISSWCIPAKKLKKKSPSGILYTKVPKTGSTVISSVLERVARNNGPDVEEYCALMYKHEDRFQFVNRDRENSFLIGSVREPISRAISRVFFMEEIDNLNDTFILQLLKSTDEQYGVMTRGKGGFQLDYMNMNQITNYSALGINSTDLNYRAIEESVQFVMNNYQFIFLNERIDESLVALQLLLDLRISDILYLSSKVSGSYFSWPNTEKCVRLEKRVKSHAITNFVSSQEWFLNNYGDYLLYAVVNRSLDLTIEAIGKEFFYNALEEFLLLKQYADSICRPMTVFPCSPEGEYQEESQANCYWNDIGCGWPCFDDLINY